MAWPRIEGTQILDLTNYRTSPEHIADYLGIKVITADVPTGWWGLYDHPRRTVVIAPGLAPVQRRCTLMHELGHAYFEHQGVTGKYELQANRWAARQLLSVDDVVHAARAEPRHNALACSLGVLPDFLTHFVGSLSHHEYRRLSMALHPAGDTVCA
ncbi:ImmA/IrrE family metallo-endopeptidase [Zhihengliuella flava]|uniref:IrrE N-terminal-like domain-containing protein n=1 Tax=Zhihengliuella flava TaxID=1285193 RepID=A0A931GDA3_9MICC|nr:ImmA/IrrE family metallo-endopeptidase [Zhihengliuella flava]MBG6083283.1 hypothetical protein [Zhihengliuella flava]